MTKEQSLERRLAAYGTMSLALAAVTASQPASAAAITSNFAPVTTVAGGAVYFNLDSLRIDLTAMPGDYELFTDVLSGLRTTSLLLAPATGGSFALSPTLPSQSMGFVERWAAGASIGPSRIWGIAASTLASNYFIPPAGEWNPVTPGSSVTDYVGLRTGTAGSFQYGWADITVNPDYTITLLGLGVETTLNDSIQTGGSAAPEPASIVLLALGAAGMEAFRRKNARRA